MEKNRSHLRGPNYGVIPDEHGRAPVFRSAFRKDNGFWKQLEEYIQDHTDAQFTHGI